MSHQTITYEIAIPRSLTVILATLAIGVLANALSPVFRIQAADADLVDKGDYLIPYMCRCRAQLRMLPYQSGL